MRMTNEKDRILAIGMMAVFVVLGVYYGAVNLLNRELSWGLLGFASILFLLIPLIVKKLGIPQPYRFYSLLFFFCIFAYDIGCVDRGYSKYVYLDKWSHFMSGTVFTILGFFLYLYLERPSGLREKRWLAVTYALFFSMFIACMWEIIEFADFNLTGHDGQNHLTTGVYDTMYDLIYCLLASLLSAASYLLYVKRGVRLVTGGAVEEFHRKLQGEKGGGCCAKG